MQNDLLERVVADVDSELKTFITKRAAQSSQHASHQKLWDALLAVVLGGGKRLRPYLMVLAAMSDGDEYNTKLVPVATGWELIHQCMLIHDDIIDRDTVRHGKSNVGGMYREYYKSLGLTDDAANHYADSAALLAGDLALSGSYQLILESDFASDVTHKVLQTFGEALDAVALGELQDTETAFVDHATINAVMIAELKTASYSFVGPLKSGAQLAGRDSKTVATFAEYGKALGIAFQLRDDWLGVFGDPKIFGKSVDSDIVEGKRTLLIEYTFASATAAESELLHNVLGNSQATATSIQAVRDLIVSTGARQRVEEDIDAYTKKAHDLLTDITMPDAVRDRFQSLERKLLQRQQ